jgi:hypothetical protein
MNEPQNVFIIPPDSARQLSYRLFSGSGLQKMMVKKKSGQILLQITPNLRVARSFPRVFRPALSAFLLAVSTVLRFFGGRLELEVSDE